MNRNSYKNLVFKTYLKNLFSRFFSCRYIARNRKRKEKTKRVNKLKNGEKYAFSPKEYFTISVE